MAASAYTLYKKAKVDEALLEVTGLTNANTVIPHGLGILPIAVFAQAKNAAAGKTVSVVSFDKNNVTLISSEAGGLNCYVCILSGGGNHAVVTSGSVA